jgi:hypothetical protein
MKPDPNKAAAPLNYRLTVLRVLMKSAKETKSFIQQKTATKMKQASQKLKNDPTDQKSQKSFAKFEKKLQLIKTVHGPEIRAASFIYAKFDFEINFDSVKDKVAQMIETDPDELVKKVFEQLKDENAQKEPYLLFYQILKEKPHKRFSETVKNLKSFVEKHQQHKESKKIKKKVQIKKKLAKRANEAEQATGDDTLTEDNGAGEQTAKSPSSNQFARNGRSSDKGQLDNSKVPREKVYIDKNRDKNRKQYDKQNFDNGRFARGRPQGRNPVRPRADQPIDGKYHPSFQAKIEKRRQQKAAPYSGEVVDL